jgi:hypothetical protein
MLKILREWGFPAGLGALWAIAAIYTLHSLSGLPHGGRPPPPEHARAVESATRS